MGLVMARQKSAPGEGRKTGLSRIGALSAGVASGVLEFSLGITALFARHYSRTLEAPGNTVVHYYLSLVSCTRG